MSGALDRARLRVELALHERSVVVGAAIFDRVDGALTVEDTDLQIFPFDQSLTPGGQLGNGTHVDDLGHDYGKPRVGIGFRD
jgi:hypothetical protein